jgi:hypothetical protein
LAAQPVLQAFSDQVVFLKHNLNAKAIQSLKTTSSKIDAQAAALIQDIDTSSKQADDFIQTLSKASWNQADGMPRYSTKFSPQGEKLVYP